MVNEVNKLIRAKYDEAPFDCVCGTIRETEDSLTKPISEKDLENIYEIIIIENGYEEYGHTKMHFFEIHTLRAPNGNGKIEHVADYEPDEFISPQQAIKLINSFIKNKKNVVSYSTYPKKFEIDEGTEKEYYDSLLTTEKIRNFALTAGAKAGVRGQQITSNQHPNIPMHLRAHKAKPKQKNGIQKLENSVRRMF